MPKALYVPLQLSLGTAIYFSASPLLAQVTSDGTVNTQVNQNGNIAEITGGETRGGNLFHSFQDFSVSTGNEAFFNNVDSISNIFSRVTGGNISNIDGLIRANGSASLFLINPAGIIFGENASLNLGGSFFASTADSLLFEGDTEFSAVNPEAPPLLEVSIPIGAKFRDNPGAIANQSNSLDANANPVGLQVDAGQSLTLVGGNINLAGGNLTAPGGKVELGAVATAGTVNINEVDGLRFAEDLDRGNVSISNTRITVNPFVSGSGGEIEIVAKDITLDSGSIVNASNLNTEGNVGNVSLQADNNIHENFFQAANSSQMRAEKTFAAFMTIVLMPRS